MDKEEEIPIRDLFEQSYTAGILEELPPPVRTRSRPEKYARTAAVVRRAPTDVLALKGCVLTPDRAIENGYVIVGPGDIISAVQEQAPEGVRIHDTEGVILPGLIDLHGHPEYNVFSAWEPPQRFDNRYQWRSSDIYRQLIRDPTNRLRDAIPGVAARYAEVRALVGGVTAIQGANAGYPDPGESLVRNVDLNIFGTHRARSLVDLPSESKPDAIEAFKRIVRDIEAEKVNAFYIHLAEGRPSDATSKREFERLVSLDGLTAATIIIHGTALDRSHFGAMREAGAKLVWSPQSNLRLYGETTAFKDALECGLLVGIGADWMPSGSTSLLGELRVARRALASQGLSIAPKRLVEMVTSDAARIAGLDARLGRLEVNRVADVLVLERRHADPWENVVQAEPSWVEFVMLGGDLSYGRADWMLGLLGPQAANELEPALAWGKSMLLDTSYSVKDTGSPPPRLSELRAALISHYPQVGPIFV